MNGYNSLTFVVAVNNEKVFRNNFMRSPLFKDEKEHQIIKQIGFKSASRAYNDGIDRSENEIIVFAHQDIVFPDFWQQELMRALIFLEETDPDWGVLGCYGHDISGDGFGYMYCTGNEKLLGRLTSRPMPIHTLDEVVLIIRKSSGLRFDQSLLNFHLYGADICVAATSLDKRCYAISAFCLHNTNKLPFLPKEFFECYKYIRKKWYSRLPIDTTCFRIERHGLRQYIIYRYVRRLRYSVERIFNRKEKMYNLRLEDPIELLNKLNMQVKLSLK